MGKGQRQKKAQTLSLAEFTSDSGADVRVDATPETKQELILAEELSSTKLASHAPACKQPATKAQFDQILEEAAAAGRAVIVDFTAAWCGPCQRIAPTFAALAAEIAWAELIKVDVDENPETAQACQISHMPTFKAYRDGGEAGTLDGTGPEALGEFVRQHAGPDPMAPFLSTLSAGQHWRQAQANMAPPVSVSPPAAVKDAGGLSRAPAPAAPASGRTLARDAPAAPAFDVIIVGAGAAGVGTALMLTKTFGLEASRVLLLERGESVGETFRRWPEEMRFISPSFNQQGWTNSFDLNSVAHGTSPAYSLHAEHPSGNEYADYLNVLASAAKLRVRALTEVVTVEAVVGKGFSVGVADANFALGAAAKRKQKPSEKLTARYVVWAAGEFQYPHERGGKVEGSELCRHNSTVRSWARLPGDDVVVIGGYESGACYPAALLPCCPAALPPCYPAILLRPTRPQVPERGLLPCCPAALLPCSAPPVLRYESGADAAFNLAKAGKQCTVLASAATWDVCDADPSTELAPYTAARLREVTAPGFAPRPKLLAPLRVVRVEKAAGGGFDVVATWKGAESLPPSGPLRRPFGASSPAGAAGSELVVHTSQPPLLCTGFEGSVAASARHLFDLADEGDEAKGCLAGSPLLTEQDESTKVPGVFLVGPTVRHKELSFCFIYKFRQRFAIVANAICTGLGHDTRDKVDICRKMNMYLDDFKCCQTTCGETC